MAKKVGVKVIIKTTNSFLKAVYQTSKHISNQND